MLRTIALAALTATLLAPVPAMAQEATPSSSPSPRAQSCPYVEFTVDRTVIKTGETVTVTAQRVAQPGQRIEARLTRLTPAPEAVVRSDTSTATIVTWPLRLGESHVLEARSSVILANGEQCIPLGRPNAHFVRVDVQPSVSIAAIRNAPRDYTFTGRVLPARSQAVTLYRHDGTRRVITAQTRVSPNGTYLINRRFLDSGRFGFSTSVGNSSTNLAGSSAIRPTVIH